jgi:hypothetical protein
MAKIKLPSYIKEGHGRMEDAVIITRNGVSFMKTYKKPEASKTEDQEEVRDAFSTLVADWKQLSGIICYSWKMHITSPNASGYNAFMGANVTHRRNGEPIMLCKGTGRKPLLNFNAVPGTGAGEIICEFIPADAGCHITFFARKEVEQGVETPVTRHDAGADAVSPFTITGLETGAQYFIYAVITDNQYDSALTISSSVSASATAG